MRRSRLRYSGGRVLAGLGSLILPMVAAHAAIRNVRVSATNTQAIITYTAPDVNACSVEISESNTYSPLVNDVDPAKFPGAHLDSRPGSLASGYARTFVAGKRSAETAADNRKYSRALQAYTTHYFRITCPTSGDAAIGNFQTLNIAAGNTFTEPQPVDRNAPGHYGWPSLSGSDRSEKVIDPFTGALIRHVSMPGDRVVSQTNQPFAMARSAGWTNASAALNANDNNAAATISGNNSANLLLLPQNNGYFGYISFLKGSHAYAQQTLNWFQVSLNMATSQSACNASPADDCKAVVCLTIDGVQCYSGGQQFEQPLTTTLTSYVFGTTGTAVDLWQQPGAHAPNSVEMATRIGYVVCDGSNKVAWNYGDFFPEFWSPGSTITINNVDYTVASIEGQTSLHVTAPCTSTNNQATNYQGTNFGVLVRKKTGSADTVFVESVKANYQLGVFPFWSFTGSFDLCGPTPVTGSNGDPGFNCALYNNGTIYWIDGLTGESHLIARNFGSGCGTFDSIIFDSVDPDTFYCSGNAPVKNKYFGNHLEPANTQTPGHFEEGENLPPCNGPNAPTNQPCLVTTSLTGTTDLGTLTSAFDPAFDPIRFVGFYFVGTENGHMVFRNWRGPAKSYGWTVVYDPNATGNSAAGNAGCVGGGLPGCVIGAIPSWNRPGARWCTLKSNDPIYTPGWLAIGPYIWSNTDEPNSSLAGRGPYISTVVDGTAFSGVTDAVGGPTDCPANSLGVSGKQCTTVTVDGEPRDPTPCITSAVDCGGAVETGAPGELMNAQPGDQFTVGAASTTEEIVMLVAKNGNQWTFQRGIGPTAHRFATTSANPGIYAFCNSIPDPTREDIAAGEWYWNYTADPHGMNRNGNTILGDHFSINAHSFYQNGAQGVAYSVDPRCAGGFGHDCYQIRNFTDIPGYVNTPVSNVTQLNPFFAGKSSLADGDQVQAHPSGVGINSAPNERQYFYDGRPFNGSYITGSAAGNGANPGTLIGAQLWKFTASQINFLDRKFLPTFAFTGNKPLLDMSSPATGDVIGTGAAGSYTYCVTNQVNECRNGSAAGDVYVNAPFVNRPYCEYPGQATGMPDEYDICVANNAMVYNSIMHMGLKWTDNFGKHQRVVTKALGRNRLISPFWHVHALANAAWFITKTEFADDIGDTVLAVRVPPPPPVDSINRGDFVPIPLSLRPPVGLGVANAVVEFGYAENGRPTDFFCTTRQEACAVGTASGGVDHVNPFWFEITEAGSLTGTPCGNGCTVSIPSVSQRVVYYRVSYRNGANAVVARGPLSTVVTP